ncbi:hypothetical protein PAMP_019143 [Pampus punctatissimus]
MDEVSEKPFLTLMWDSEASHQSEKASHGQRQREKSQQHIESVGLITLRSLVRPFIKADSLSS